MFLFSSRGQHYGQKVYLASYVLNFQQHKTGSCRLLCISIHNFVLECFPKLNSILIKKTVFKLREMDLTRTMMNCF